jgi:hypothetical protein
VTTQGWLREENRSQRSAYVSRHRVPREAVQRVAAAVVAST